MPYRMICGMLLLGAVAKAETPVGLVSWVSGKVQIIRTDEREPVPARPADLLQAGDRILTGPEAETTFLFCPQSRAAKILADSEVEFAANTLRVRKGKLTEERPVPSCRLPSNLTLAAASQLQSGMLRLRGSNLLLRSPSRTNIATLQPRFRWEAVDNAKTYDLKLLDREERVLWRQSGSSTEARYPADATPLAWGQKYWWRVAARDEQDTLLEAGTYFQTLTAEQAEQVRSGESGLRQLRDENPKDNGPRFLLAFFYEDYGMLEEAAELYSELIRQIGPQPWVQGRLNEVLRKLGWDNVETSPPR